MQNPENLRLLIMMELIDVMFLGNVGSEEKDAEIYLAGGCFWGLEEYFSRIPGVEKTTVGYANGQVETTNYHWIKETDHAETVQVVYDPDKITSERLAYYFRVIDPSPH